MGRSQHRKYAEKHSIIRNTSHQQRRFTSTLNSQNQGERTDIRGTLSVCFVSQRDTGLKNARRDGSERTQRETQIFTLLLCLNRGHNASVCSRRSRALCTRCKRVHHRSISNDTGTATPHTRETTPTTVGKIDVASPNFTYFQTARIWVMRLTGLSKFTRCVLDVGSQSNLIPKTD